MLLDNPTEKYWMGARINIFSPLGYNFLSYVQVRLTA